MPDDEGHGMYNRISFTAFVTELRSTFKRVQWNGVRQKYVDFLVNTK